jgi:hypothetical protein
MVSPLPASSAWHGKAALNAQQNIAPSIDIFTTI